MSNPTAEKPAAAAPPPKPVKPGIGDAIRKILTGPDDTEGLIDHIRAIEPVVVACVFEEIEPDCTDFVTHLQLVAHLCAWTGGSWKIGPYTRRWKV